jgi:ribonuclease-3
LLNFFKAKASSNPDKILSEKIFLLTGVKPKNISLYHQAFRHSSVATEIKDGIKNSNERLEYLGDAALGTIVAEFLFKTYPFKGEGFLTQMRSRIVNRSRLNQLAIKIGLNELISFEVSGNRVGSIYGDAFEALIGAILLDRGYEVAREFVLHRILKTHLDIAEIERTETDYKSKLLNWGQQNKRKINFVVEKESGPSHNRMFLIRVIIDGKEHEAFEHHSKRRAEQLAAEKTFLALSISE